MTAARAFSIAMVLAAGRGVRMRPLSDVLPKPALPLPEGPVFASALRLAASAGATRIVVNSNHLAERMAEALSSIAIPGVEIVPSVEEHLMGTAGGLALARERGLLGDQGPVLVLNGDGVLGLDLDSLTERHLRSNDLVTLALLPHLDPNRWSRVTLDTDGLVEAILPPGRPRPLEAPFLYPGVMAVHRDALEALPVVRSEVSDTLWNTARSSRRLGGTVVSGHWREVGTPQDYLEVMRNRLADATVISPSADVSATATVSRSFVGRRAVIAGETVVESSVVAEGARVEAGATVTRSVLLGAVKTGPGEVLIDAVRARTAGD